jgi:hypothetical protein
VAQAHVGNQRRQLRPAVLLAHRGMPLERTTFEPLPDLDSLGVGAANTHPFDLRGKAN